MKHAELTMLIQKDEESDWYVGQLEEFPAAISQGKTIEELKANLIDALKLLLETQKESLRKTYGTENVITHTLEFA